MPGIAGIISKKKNRNAETLLDSMIGVMKYEKFYTEGGYLNEEMGIYIGGAVHKDSFSDCLPVCNEKKDLILIYYGENHVNAEAINKIKSKYYNTATNDASYLVNLYEENNQDFFKKLNGWFCGLLVDLRKKKAFLFNDRFGMQRLYYHEDSDALYFASEAKCILKIKPELKEIPLKNLAELISCKCVLENRSLFKDIYLLPGGSAWEIDPGETIKRNYYFKPSEYESLSSFNEADFYPHLKEKIVEILPKYFISDRPMAFSLTGGMDTRTILSNISTPIKNVQCYSHSGEYRDCFDARLAHKIAKLCGMDHYTLRMDDKFYADFPTLAEKTIYTSDGYMDLNGTPSLYLHSKAREIGDIRFTGNFGDQVLVSRINLKPFYKRYKIFDNELSTEITNAPERLKSLSGDHNPLSFFLFKQAPWFDYSRFSVEQSQMVQRSPFMDNELIELLYKAPAGLLSSGDIRMRLIRDGNPDLAKIPTERGNIAMGRTLSSEWLRLYRKYLFQAEYYFSYGMPNWMAKLNNTFRMFKLEYLFLDQNKYYNLRKMFRYELADYVKQILLDNRTLNRPFIKRKLLEKMVIDHTTGQGNYTSEINLMLCIELTYRKLIEE